MKLKRPLFSEKESKIVDLISNFLETPDKNLERIQREILKQKKIVKMKISWKDST